MSEPLLPSKIFAGDKLEFTESDGDYKASNGWAMKYVLINASNKITDLVSVASGDDHLFSITSLISAAWVKGTYQWERYAEKSGTIEKLNRGTVVIEPDIIALATYDFRTHARKTLEALEAAIEGRADKAQLSIQMSVRGSSRGLQYLSHDELIRARNYYKILVQQEEQQELIEQGKAPGNKILIQFN